MKSEKMSVYRVIEVGNNVLVATLDFETLGYQTLYRGKKLDEGRNLLYIENDPKNYVVWLSDDMNLLSVETPQKGAIILNNMALCEKVGFGYLMFNIEKVDLDLYQAVGNVFGGEQKRLWPKGSFAKGNTVFYRDNPRGNKMGAIKRLGEKVSCPQEDVWAFWAAIEGVFTMLFREGNVYFWAQEECKSFRTEEKGFILEKEDGSEVFFPYWKVLFV